MLQVKTEGPGRTNLAILINAVHWSVEIQFEQSLVPYAVDRQRVISMCKCQQTVTEGMISHASLYSMLCAFGLITAFQICLVQWCILAQDSVDTASRPYPSSLCLLRASPVVHVPCPSLDRLLQMHFPIPQALVMLHHSTRIHTI